MKLFYSPGSCSLASHIMLEEANAKFDVQRVTLAEGEQRKPEYLKINPKGKVPALQLDGGVVLTENPAIISYVADTHPGVGLLEAPGTVERAKAQEWLAWCASGMHRDFGPLFSALRTKIAPEASAKATVQADFDAFDRQLAGKRFILGDRFSAADAYTLVFTYWSKLFGLGLGEHMKASARALCDRAGVRRAITTQGLDFDFLR
jgi:glutathione S-transferase